MLISKQEFKNFQQLSPSLSKIRAPKNPSKNHGGGNHYGRIRKGTKYAGIAFNKVVAVLQTLEEKVSHRWKFGSCERIGEITHWSNHHWSVHFRDPGHPSSGSFTQICSKSIGLPGDFWKLHRAYERHRKGVGTVGCQRVATARMSRDGS